MKILIRNAMALMDDAGAFKLETKNVYIDGKNIIKVTEPDESFAFDAEKVIDATGKLLMPGLINAHTHAYMSLFRNYADDQGFWDWLANVQSVEEGMTEEDCYWGTMLNAIEMIKTGTTCFVDMNIRSAKNGAKTGPEGACASAAYDSGMRAVLTRGMVGSVGEDYPELQLKQFEAEADIFKDEDRIMFMYGPHAPYSCMADNLQRFTKLAVEKDWGVNIHLSESESEVENMIKDKGMTPIAYCDSLGVFEARTIAAHCVNATDDDIKIFAKRGVSVALNPKSNMKLGNGFAPAEKFLEAGVNLTLGTDGCGSNNTQNMFAEMNTAALIYKGANKKPQCISANDVLHFATVNGAKAIGMEGKLGVIKEGALADLIILDVYTPEFFPSTNLVSGLVYSGTGKEVETVIIDGEMVMEDRKILTMDVDEVYTQCEKICSRLNMFK